MKFEDDKSESNLNWQDDKVQLKLVGPRCEPSVQTSVLPSRLTRQTASDSKDSKVGSLSL